LDEHASAATLGARVAHEEATEDCRGGSVGAEDPRPRGCRPVTFDVAIGDGESGQQRAGIFPRMEAETSVRVPGTRLAVDDACLWIPAL